MGIEFVLYEIGDDIQISSDFQGKVYKSIERKVMVAA